MPEMRAFLGDWQIERRVEDFRKGHKTTFKGTAVFEEQGGTLDYRETGHMELVTGQRLEGSQRYTWTALAEGEVDVFFANGVFFHRFACTALRSETTHFCAPDTYLGDYDFSQWPTWSLTWCVTGPRKDYRMHSTYTRRLSTLA